MAEQTLYDLQKILRGLETRIDKAQCCCESLTGQNLGLGNKIFYSKNKNFLQFRTLIAGSNITITTDSNNETITINSIGGGSAFTCSDLNSCSTSNLPEGTNLYYTDARVLSYMTGKNISIFTNDSGYITSSALTPYLTISTAASTYYPIPTGTTLEYLRGDGSLATFPTIPAAQNLQQVTDVGNTTTNSITLDDTVNQIVLDNTGLYGSSPNIHIFDNVVGASSALDINANEINIPIQPAFSFLQSCFFVCPKNYHQWSNQRCQKW